jgi:hypothetical protein
MWFIIRGLAVGGPLTESQLSLITSCPRLRRFWRFDVDNAHQTFNLSIFA